MADTPLIPTTDVYVIGVDPGKSCGLATLCDARLVAIWQGPVGALPERLEQAISYARTLTDRPIVVACERFIKRPERGGNVRSAQPDAEQAIGAVKLIAEREDVRLLLQQPSSVKTFAPNSLLRQLGLYVSARNYGWPDADDANDAVRHALLCTATVYASVFERRITEIGT